MGIRLHPGFLIAAIGYMTGIFFLSAAPPDAGGSGVLGAPLVWNLLHVPVFAGLAVLVLLSLSDGRWRVDLPWRVHGWTITIGALCAALDEWHQSFVPGRQPSVADFLLNCVGIGGVVAWSRLAGRRSEGR